MMSRRFYSHAQFQSQVLKHRRHFPLLAILTATSLGQQQYPELVPRFSSARHASSEASKDGKNDKGDNKGETRFDITKRWDDVKADWETLLQTSTNSKTQDSKGTAAPPTKASSLFSKLKDAVEDAIENKDDGKANTPSNQDNYKVMGSNLMNLVQKQWGSKLTGSSSGTSQANTVQDIITQARNMEDQGEVNDSISLTELLEIAQLSNKRLEQKLLKFLQEESKKSGKVFTSADLPTLNPPDIYYYIEKEDQYKNHSVKRRQHRFFAGVDVNQMDELNEQLQLALLSYADTMEEIQTTLRQTFDFELAYCDMESTPGRPSHFIAVNKDSIEKNKESALSFLSSDASTLEVIMVVRGTKTITDIITDLLMDEEEYKGGYCHNGILESGQYLAEKHTKLFRNLLQVSGKKKIKLTLIGHSLGAGAATIAGMELNELPEMDVQVVGFGCPALLSKKLSQQTESFVTTVVADNDCIPRTSSATMLNAILDIASFDWTPYAKQDLTEAVNEVSSYFPTLLKGYKQTILDTVHGLPIRDVPTNIPAKRAEPILYPPGKCIHLYRDGFGISGNVVPCTFFSELDINRRMLHDHTVDAGYQLIFLDLMRQHHEDHYFQFQKEKK